MGFRLRKTFRLGKLFHVNLSKSGVGMSFGVNGARVGIGPRGRRITLGIPGTGIGYISQSKKPKRSTKHIAQSSPSHISIDTPAPLQSYATNTDALSSITSPQTPPARMSKFTPWQWVVLSLLGGAVILVFACIGVLILTYF